MTSIFNAMKKLVPQGMQRLLEFLKSQSPGQRLVAIAILHEKPDPAQLDWLALRLDPDVETSFVGYQAAVALREAVGRLPKEFEARLSQSLQKALSLAERNMSDPPHLKILASALRELTRNLSPHAKLVELAAEYERVREQMPPVPQEPEE